MGVTVDGVAFPPYDGKLFRDRKNAEADVHKLAWAISRYLHNCTGTKHCTFDEICVMCFNAARLSLQHLEPKYAKKHVAALAHALGVDIEIDPIYPPDGG